MKNIDYLQEYQKLGLTIPNKDYKGPDEQVKQFVFCSVLRYVETTASTMSLGYQEKDNNN